MSGPTTDPTGQIVKPPKPADATSNLMTLIERMKPEMARALPRHVTPDRMARIVLTAVRTNPKLAVCTPASFLGCVMSLAQLGLEPNTPLGHAYLIPRKSKHVTGALECTMIVGYQGMLDLARRSGLVSNLYAYAVREGDEFSYALGTERYIKHRPSDDPLRESKPITHVYAVARIKNGEPEFEVLTIAQVNARRARSMASGAGPWITDFEAMALKSGMRALFRWLPKSAEMARAELIEVAADTGKGIVGAVDETVAGLLASQGLAEPDESGSGAEVVEEVEPDGPAVIEGANLIAEVDRLCKEMNISASERNALVLKHKADFGAILAELRGVASEPK